MGLDTLESVSAPAGTTEGVTSPIAEENSQVPVTEGAWRREWQWAVPRYVIDGRRA
jgi:hypothetical protein